MSLRWTGNGDMRISGVMQELVLHLGMTLSSNSPLGGKSLARILIAESLLKSSLQKTQRNIQRLFAFKGDNS